MTTQSAWMTNEFSSPHSFPFLQQIFNAMAESALLVDENLIIRQWNSSLELMADLPHHQVVGRRLSEIFALFPGSTPEEAHNTEVGGDNDVDDVLQQYSAWGPYQKIFKGLPFSVSYRPFSTHLLCRKSLQLHITPLLEHHKICGALIKVQQNYLPSYAFHPQSNLLQQQQQEHLALNAQERFQRMADCSPVLLWMAGQNGECTFFNQTWLEFSGRTMQEELGVGWAEGIHHEDLQRSLDHYNENFFLRKSFEMEYRLRRKDGQYRWILDRGIPLFLPSGQFSGFIGSCTDITERKMAETQLLSLTERLQSRNDDLQHFAFAVSHDLQGPIRSIINYLDLLTIDYKDKLDVKGKQYFELVINEGKRLKNLIHGLLDFILTENKVKKMGPVSFAVVVKNARQALQHEIEEAQAEIVLETSFYETWGNELQLTLLLQNFFSNALKYRQPQRRPQIHVGMQALPQQWTIWVRDNGIGIKKEYFDKIFIIFNRLHNQKEYPGSGIGLAISKKIVTSHGGKIWVQSQEGEGSTFFFSLPRQQLHQHQQQHQHQNLARD